VLEDYRGRGGEGDEERRVGVYWVGLGWCKAYITYHL
jgi:hypothetical protein